MYRVYYLVPNLQQVTNAITRLDTAGIGGDRIHVMARDAVVLPHCYPLGYCFGYLAGVLRACIAWWPLHRYEGSGTASPRCRRQRRKSPASLRCRRFSSSLVP